MHENKSAAVLSITLLTLQASPALASIGGVDEPDALGYLEIVPGLAESSTTASSTETLDAGLGATIDGANGAPISIERLGVEDAAEILESDGTAVIEDASRDTDAVMQTLADGIRMIEVISSPDAPTNFSYSLAIPEGLELFPQEDGSILVGSEEVVGDEVTIDVESMIGAPWAVDATGSPVDASYVLDDDVLTMRVDHGAEIEYPVVADPTVTRGGFKVVYSLATPWALTVYLNKARTADAEDVGAAICIGIAFVPAVGGAAAAVCGLHNIAIRTTSRYGYCQYWVLSTITRSFDVRLYRGSYCS